MPESIAALESNRTGRYAKTSFTFTRENFEFASKSPLRHGCYALEIVPERNDAARFYEWKLGGTLRVSVDDENKSTQCSGDSYLQLVPKSEELRLLRFWDSPPRADDAIPVWPRNFYAYYVAVTALASQGELVQIAFDLLRPVEGEAAWDPQTSSGPFSAELLPSRGDSNSASDVAYRGTIRDPRGQSYGTLELRWISEYLRGAHIEVQSISGTPRLDPPADQRTPTTLEDAFRKAGWYIHARQDDLPLQLTMEQPWTLDQLHRTMQGWREHAQLDDRWTYHLLLVPAIDQSVRGVMYDWRNADLNGVPREGAALESQDFFAADAPLFGDLPDSVRRSCYFRSAVHEIGHMMGLEHRHDHGGYMNTTDSIAAGPEGLVEGIVWDFHEQDEWGLRHLPDFIVRPGGIPASFCGALDRC